MKLEKKSDKKIEMTENERKALLKAQQTEMNHVLIYTNLGNVVTDKAVKDQLKLIAAEEGKHASILKTYTGEVLKPKAFPSMWILFLVRILGFKRVSKILSKQELSTASKTDTYVEQFKKLKEIVADDRKHADRILKLGGN